MTNQHNIVSMVLLCLFLQFIKTTASTSSLSKLFVNWRNRQSNSDSCKCSCYQDKYAVGGTVMLKDAHAKSQKPLKEEFILSLTLNIKGFWVAL